MRAWTPLFAMALGCSPAFGGGGAGGGGGKADEWCAGDGGCGGDADVAAPTPLGPASIVLVSATLHATSARGTDWDTLSNGNERLPDPYFALARASGAVESFVRTRTTRNSLSPVLEDPELDSVDDLSALTSLRIEVLDDDGITSQIMCIAELPLDGVVAMPYRWERPCAEGALVVDAVARDLGR